MDGLLLELEIEKILTNIWGTLHYYYSCILFFVIVANHQSSLEIKNDKIILEILKSKQQILESKNVNKHPGCLFEQGRSFPPILTEGAPIRTGALIRSFTVANF